LVGVTSDELKAFLGVIINMVLNLKAHYWIILLKSGWTECHSSKMFFSHQRFFKLFWALLLVPLVATQEVSVYEAVN
jgi:hypothetical protein